jgi:hypothetical protein
MKRTILSLLLVLIATFLLADTWFLNDEPSAINRGMGDVGIGIADVWHTNALNCWTNPAMAAFNNGITIGGIRDKIYDDEDSPWDDLYYNAGMWTLSTKGLAVILPGLNASGQLGITQDYGKYEQTDENGNSLGKHRTYDNAIPVGVAFNPFKTIRDLNPSLQNSLLENIDFSVGGNVIKIKTNSNSSESDDEVNEATIYNLGCTGRLGLALADIIKIEASAGANRFNPTIEKIKTQDYYGGYEVEVTNYTGIGAGGKVSLISKGFLGNDSFLSEYFPTLASLKVLVGRKIYDKDYEFGSAGAELGLLDMLYLRAGKQLDDEWKTKDTATTMGGALNLHYKSVATFNINYSKVTYKDNDFADDFTAWDCQLSLDFLSSAKELNLTK